MFDRRTDGAYGKSFTHCKSQTAERADSHFSPGPTPQIHSNIPSSTTVSITDHNRIKENPAIKMESGSIANSLICALSGQSPILDPVVTPSGRICSKRLLLSKLVETNGRDPFTDAYLDESKLVDIHTPFADASVVPPRLSGANSFPSLLYTIQAEYDALILELFDTRKALEETRRELSMALYQNDAAVRVIARTLTERDAARAELSRVSSSGPTPHATGLNKRKRMDGDHELPALNNKNIIGEKDDAEEKTPNIVEMDMDDSSNDVKVSSSSPNHDGNLNSIPRVIPTQDLQAMLKKREELSSYRRSLKKKAKQDRDDTGYASMETFKLWQCLHKKNYHKTSSKPGILALAGPVVSSGPNSRIVTHGRDKQIIVYSTASETIIKTISFKATVAFLDLFHDPIADNDLIYVCDSDGVVTSYSGNDFDTIASASLPLIDKEKVVGMVIHPIGNVVFLTSNLGHIFVLSLTNSGSTLHLTTKVVDETLNHSNVEYLCSRLHPDGLLLAVGRSDGKICVWDLQSSKLASSFTVRSFFTFSLIALLLSHADSIFILYLDLSRGRRMLPLSI